MITRRKLWGMLASAIGAVGIGVPTASRLQAAIDAKMLAEFPGSLLFRPNETSAEFIRYQKWFRDHPQLLWGAPYHSEAELVRQKAVCLSEPFHAANPHVEYDAWVDTCTDNVLMKVYHRDRERDIEIGLGMAITRKAIREKDDLNTVITEGWTALTEAVNERPIRPEWQRIYDRWPDKTIMGLAQLKVGGGYPV